MEPDLNEELPEPEGVTVNLDPTRVLAMLQRRAATLIQNLQWELATRDALVEVMEQRLNESEQLREEAEGAIEQYVAEALESARLLSVAREQRDMARAVVKELQAPDEKGDAFLQASDTAKVDDTLMIAKS